jgi:hypothetical protein
VKGHWTHVRAPLYIGNFSCCSSAAAGDPSGRVLK